MTLLALATVTLVDRADEAGLDFESVCGSRDKLFIYETLGSGAAFLDYDQDGDLDIYLVNGAETLSAPGPPNRLYRNDGSGAFNDVTEASGTGDTGFGVAVAVADIDRDGHPDLFVANNGPDVLFVNRGDGTFRRTELDDNLMAGGAAFGDYDSDGWPDLYVSSYVERAAFESGGPGRELCNWKGLRVGCGPRGLPGAPDRLYRNEHGRFRDTSESVGITSPVPSYGLGVLFQDLSSDHRPDIYVANDSRPNFLFILQDDGTFADEGLMRGVAYSGEAMAQAGMGVDAADLDGDGEPEIVVTNFSHDHTTLYSNLGRGFFIDVSYPRGIGKETYRPLSWGARFVDLNADGALDLFLAHGHIYPAVDGNVEDTSYAEPNQVFVNDGAGRFHLQPASEAPPLSSRGVASGDYDEDGRIDLLVTSIDGPVELLHNETEHATNTLVVQLVGTSATREGLGATVTVEASGLRQVREVSSAGSYASASDSRLHFGLGHAGAIDFVEVRWPSGARERIDSPPRRSLLVIKQGTGLVATRTHTAR